MLELQYSINYPKQFPISVNDITNSEKINQLLGMVMNLTPQ